MFEVLFGGVTPAVSFSWVENNTPDLTFLAAHMERKLIFRFKIPASDKQHRHQRTNSNSAEDHRVTRLPDGRRR